MNLIFEVVKGKLAAFFIREKARGALSKDADPSNMAEFCIALIQGAMLMGKIKRNSDPAKVTVREALAHLKRYTAGGVQRRPRHPVHHQSRATLR